MALSKLEVAKLQLDLTQINILLECVKKESKSNSGKLYSKKKGKHWRDEIVEGFKRLTCILLTWFNPLSSIRNRV